MHHPKVDVGLTLFLEEVYRVHVVQNFLKKHREQSLSM